VLVLAIGGVTFGPGEGGVCVGLQTAFGTVDLNSRVVLAITPESLTSLDVVFDGTDG
jgi:hypothetical protein